MAAGLLNPPTLETGGSACGAVLEIRVVDSVLDSVEGRGRAAGLMVKAAYGVVRN